MAHGSIRTFDVEAFIIKIIRVCVLDLRSENNVITAIRYKYQDCIFKIWNGAGNICRSYETFIVICTKIRLRK